MYSKRDYENYKSDLNKWMERELKILKKDQENMIRYFQSAADTIKRVNHYFSHFQLSQDPARFRLHRQRVQEIRDKKRPIDLDQLREKMQESLFEPREKVLHAVVMCGFE